MDLPLRSIVCKTKKATLFIELFMIPNPDKQYKNLDKFSYDIGPQFATSTITCPHRPQHKTLTALMHVDNNCFLSCLLLYPFMTVI